MTYDGKDSKYCYLKLFSSVVITKGFARSLLVDFDRNIMHLIPNTLYEFILECKANTLSNVLEKYNVEDKQIINSYIEFLEQNEFIIFTAHPENFPELEPTWKSPNFISNAVIDIDITSKHDYSLIASLLSTLRCYALDVRIFETIGYEIIYELLENTVDCSIRSLRIILPYTMYKSEQECGYLLKKYPRLSLLVFHGSPVNEFCPRDAQGILLVQNPVSSPTCCGYVSEQLMKCNISLFMESRTYNSCLNKKLSIDTHGIIKNCTAMQEGFGHYSVVDIIKLVQSQKFTKYWSINKDKIIVCQDCEFRYVCVDCRAIIRDKTNILSKPLHCNYDPYTATYT